MGKNQSKPGVKSNGSVNLFERDPRLMQKMVFIPELFPYFMQSIIKDTQRLYDKLPSHPLEETLFDAINERFSSSPSLPKHTQLQSGNLQYYELQKKEVFLALLQKFERNIHVENHLQQIVYKHHDKGRKNSIRKIINPMYESQLTLPLYSKLFLNYYIILLKKYFSSKDQEERDFVKKFHEQIGKLLCSMIESKHIIKETLEDLVYRIVKVQKYGKKQILLSNFSQIRHNFWPIYLKKEHSISVSPSQYDRIRQIARCYLDEIYIHTIKQAHDPEIESNQHDNLKALRNFPISKVKKKFDN